MNDAPLNLTDIKVSKPIKVKAWKSCTQIDDNQYELCGVVSMVEAKMMENILRLARKPAGTLDPDELSLVAALLALQGK